jgi:hypothetical protein
VNKHLKLVKNQKSQSDLSLSYLSFLTAQLNRLKNIYEQEETKLMSKKASDSDSVPTCYRFLEMRASRFKFDELLKPISTFIKDNQSLDTAKSQQKTASKVFKTSVSHSLSLEGLHKEKVVRQAAHLRWFQSWRLSSGKLLLISFLFPIFLGIGLGVRSAQNINSSMPTPINEYTSGAVQGLFNGVVADFFILYVLLTLPENLFLNYKIRIKEVEQIQLPQLQQTLLKLQALDIDPYVELDFCEEKLTISLYLDLAKLNTPACIPLTRRESGLSYVPPLKRFAPE